MRKKTRPAPRLARNKPTSSANKKHDEEPEWVGKGESPEDSMHDGGFFAIDFHDAPALGQYLRETEVPSEVIVRRMADLLDPPVGADTILAFQRRRSRGRPVAKDKRSKEQHLYMLLRFARAKLGGQLEAAMADVAKKTGLGRSSLMAIWSAHHHEKRPPKKPKMD